MCPIRFSDDADRSPADLSPSERCPVPLDEPRLEVRVHDVDRDVIVVTGEIDPTTAALFRTALEEALTRAPRVVVDLSGVTFIDSTGISALIDAYQSVRPPGTLVLRSPSPTARRLLDLTGLDQIMSIEGDPDRDGCSTPPVEVRSELVFDIGNRDAGRVIDVKMRQSVTAANWPTAEKRLLKLIAVRQPNELHIEFEAGRLPDSSAAWLDKIGSALADLGGTLTVSPSAASSGAA